MKTITRDRTWLVGCLFMALFLHNCTPPNEGPSNEYLFTDLRNLKMPETKLRVAAPTVVTPATVTSSTLAAAVTNGIVGIPGSGQVPPVVSQAIANANSAFAAVGTTAGTIAGGFTPEVITTLTSTGLLPAGLQGPITALRTNPTLQPYFPAASLPQVNGQTVTPTTISLPTPTPAPVTPAVVLNPVNYTGPDACFKQANDLFDQVTVNLNINRVSQINSVSATYAQEKTAADGEVSNCAASTLNKYSQLTSAARTALNGSLASLQAARPTLGEANYTTLLALTYVQYANLIQIYTDFQKAELNTCVIERDMRIASALVARDANISLINEAFNATVRTAQNLVLQLLDSCHNQGSGR
jgi:hypothetical protein